MEISGWIPSSSRSSPDLNDGELNDQLYLPSSMSMIGVQLASLSQADENLFSHTTFSQKLLARLHTAANNFASNLWYKRITDDARHDAHVPWAIQ